MIDDIGSVALLGALTGSLATMILQIIRDGQVNRRDVRAAARVIRSEIIRNQSTVQVLRAFGIAPPGEDVRIRTTRLDGGLDRLAIELPRDEVGLLLSFLQMTEGAETRVESAKQRAGHGLTPQELDWFQGTWIPAADFCQVLLDARGQRWWYLLFDIPGWVQFRRRRSEVLRDGFAAPQLDAFLAKHQR